MPLCLACIGRGAIAPLACTLLLCLFVYFPSFCQAQQISQLDVTQSHQALSKHTQWLYHNAFQVEQVMREESWGNEPGLMKRLQFGTSALWLRVALDNASDVKLKRYLQIKKIGVQHIHLFIQDRKTGNWSSLIAGESQPFSLQGQQHRHVLFPIEVAENSGVQLYVRFSGLGGQPIQWDLLTLEEVEAEREFTGLLLSMFMGLGVGLVSILLIMFSVLKKVRFLAYSAYGTGILFLLLSSTGLGYQFIWSNSIVWQLYCQFFSGIMVLLSAMVILQSQEKPLLKSSAEKFSKFIALACFTTLGFLWAIPKDVLLMLRAVPLIVLGCFGAWYAYVVFSDKEEGSVSVDSMILGPIFFAGGLIYCTEYFLGVLYADHTIYLAGWLLQLSLLVWAGVRVYSDQLQEQMQLQFNQMKKEYDQDSFEQQLLLQTLYDSVTSFPNRIALLKILETLIEKDRGQFSVYLIDITGITEIINTLGHHNGDELFKRVARRIDRLAQQYEKTVNLDQRKNRRSVLSIVDTRVMALIYQDREGEEQDQFGKNLVRCLSYPFEFKRMTLDISAYMGVARFPVHGQTASELLQHAYVAAEMAKERGDSLLYYDSQINPYSARRLTLVSELTSALRLDLLELYYQPQIDIRHNTIVGFECLLRWHHPQYGFVSPAEFIPLAEKTGVISQLTLWVFENALIQAATWQTQGLNVRISVNLSARNLQTADLPEQIETLMKNYQVPPHLIALEITETAMMLDPTSAVNVVKRLHELGLRLSVDDFGMGYSSLAYLKRLPVSEIKVDRVFVREMCQELNDQIIVNTTLNMGHNLGLEIVAEGVEDERTYLTLKRLGCDFAQGFYIAKPMPADEVDRWLESCPYKVPGLGDEAAAS